MTTIEQQPRVDEEKLHAFVFEAVEEVGAALNAALVVMSDELGLYRALADAGPAGFDYHAASIETARARAAAAGVSERVTFETVPAGGYSGDGYDLVTMFDCLHDMGDPVGAARHVRETIAPDGTWMIVEPMAGNQVEDNLNAVGRAHYGFSTLLCTPASLSQEVGLALGAQAGEARMREVVSAGGFSTCRRAAETPFNMILEARP